MKKTIMFYTLCTALVSNITFSCDKCSNCEGPQCNAKASGQNDRSTTTCADTCTACNKEQQATKSVVQISEVEVVEISTQKVLGLREKGSYSHIGEMVPKLYEYIISKNIKCAGFPTFICHECSAEEAYKANTQGTADLEVCIPVDDSLQTDGDFIAYELQGCKMAKIVRTGAYGECEQVFGKLHAWLAKNNYKIAGNTREVYLNNPIEVKEEDLITEIYTPIEAIK